MEAQVGPESTIGSRVSQSRHKWILDGGREPKHLYVGQLEYEALLELVRGLDTGVFSKEGRFYFMGLRVHRVLEPEHLRVY